MLTWFRRIVRAQTVGALIALIVCAGMADLVHAGGDDPACDPPLVLHDGSAHHFTTGGPTQPGPANHCALCHLLRLLHTALSAHPSAAVSAFTVEARWFADRWIAVATLATGVPSRAPPSTAL
jgi:hypothetical protein